MIKTIIINGIALAITIAIGIAVLYVLPFAIGALLVILALWGVVKGIFFLDEKWRERRSAKAKSYERELGEGWADLMESAKKMREIYEKNE